MNWFKVSFSDVFFNGLTTAEVGCVVKYKCMCQQLDVEELSLEKLRTIFNSREIKFVQKYFKLCSDFDRSLSEVCSESVQSLSEVCSESVQSLSEVCSESVQSLSEVCSEKDNKNKDLARARVDNNIINKDNNKTERKERKERENKGDVSPEKIYPFEGEIIRLKQKDFDQWQKAYPDLNLYAELMVRDKYLATLDENDKARKNWFLSTSQYFVKRNEMRKQQNAEFSNNREEESFEEYLERSIT